MLGWSHRLRVLDGCSSGEASGAYANKVMFRRHESTLSTKASSFPSFPFRAGATTIAGLVSLLLRRRRLQIIMTIIVVHAVTQ